MRLIHIDTDISGSSSIAHLIPTHVQTIKAARIEDARGVVDAIKTGRIHGDMVLLDSVTGLVERLRQQITEKSKRTKSNRDDYYETGESGKRLFAELREVQQMSMPSIFIAHEKSTAGMASRLDPLGSGLDKYVPNAQKELNSDLFAFADAIIRLYPHPGDLLDSAGNRCFECEGEYWPAGTRVLILKPTVDSTAGVRTVWGHPTPAMMVVREGDPYAFVRFIQAIGGAIPHNIVLYGPPKIGKTTFAAGAVYL